jgi:hypothetical protein
MLSGLWKGKWITPPPPPPSTSPGSTCFPLYGFLDDWHWLAFVQRLSRQTSKSPQDEHYQVRIQYCLLFYFFHFMSSSWTPLFPLPFYSEVPDDNSLTIKKCERPTKRRKKLLTQAIPVEVAYCQKIGTGV